MVSVKLSFEGPGLFSRGIGSLDFGGIEKQQIDATGIGTWIVGGHDLNLLHVGVPGS